jgi:predicted secreted protein with PEFG-CTERM motif
MNSKFTFAIVLAAILAVVAVPTSAFAATVNASIVPGATTKTTDAYDPYPIEINKGDEVIWTNNDSALHTVTSGSNGEPTGLFGGTASAPALMPPKKTQSFTFTEEGEYPYFCVLHPAMVGLVKVSAGGGGMQETSATTEFDGQTYTVEAKSSAVKVTGLAIDAGKAVNVNLSGEGEVELELPTAMISGISSVMAGSTGVDFTQVESDDESTTIKFTVPAGTSSVQIMGAKVIPEFGVIAAIVLAASLVAVIGFARFKGTSFGIGRF